MKIHPLNHDFQLILRNNQLIGYKRNGGQSKSFCFNKCSIQSLSISVEESGCAGLVCNQQKNLEVQRYKQDCCCYSYDSRRTNVINDHSLEINN